MQNAKACQMYQKKDIWNQYSLIQIFILQLRTCILYILGSTCNSWRFSYRLVLYPREGTLYMLQSVEYWPMRQREHPDLVPKFGESRATAHWYNVLHGTHGPASRRRTLRFGRP